MSTFSARTKSCCKSFRRFGSTANTTLTLLVLAESLAWVPYAASGQKAQTPAPKAKVSKQVEDADQGKRLYAKYGCYECHGYQGQGSAAAAPRIAPDPISIEALIAYLRHPAGEMPPYTERVVSDAELANIRAFLATIPQGTKPSDITLLK
jgi:mono/diheme cytochrome c family protein